MEYVPPYPALINFQGVRGQLDASVKSDECSENIKQIIEVEIHLCENLHKEDHNEV